MLSCMILLTTMYTTSTGSVSQQCREFWETWFVVALSQALPLRITCVWSSKVICYNSNTQQCAQGGESGNEARIGLWCSDKTVELYVGASCIMMAVHIHMYKLSKICTAIRP